MIKTKTVIYTNDISISRFGSRKASIGAFTIFILKILITVEISQALKFFNIKELTLKNKRSSAQNFQLLYKNILVDFQSILYHISI